jgi:hypothetical protein
VVALMVREAWRLRAPLRDYDLPAGDIGYAMQAI